MLHILTGSDPFAKEKYIEGIVRTSKQVLEKIDATAEGFSPHLLLGGDLFSPAKIMVVRGPANSIDIVAFLDAFKKSANTIIFIPDSLDKRLKWVQLVMADKQVKVMVVDSPSYAELSQYIGNRLKDLGVVVGVDIVNRIAESFTPAFQFALKQPISELDMRRLGNELEKIKSFTITETLTVKALEDLLVLQPEADVLDIANAVGDKQRKKVFVLLDNLYVSELGGDDKGKTIQLAALLAEQFRSLLFVKVSLEAHWPDEKIIETTGWKTGRLFVLRKLASKFEIKTLQGLLLKLEALDIELKTTSTPPRVLLELILLQA